VDSIFDSLPGVGPARRRILMERFGTADALVGASRDDLESVPGLPAKVGREVYAALHRTD
jgi:excinuclease ABC subunit C